MSRTIESPKSFAQNNKELLSVNLGQAPAFCYQYPDSSKITMKNFIAQVNTLRTEGVICNAAYPYIVGYIQNSEDFDYIHKLQDKKRGILGIGAPMKGGFSDIVINTVEQELDLGGPSLIAAVRLVQTIHDQNRGLEKLGDMDRVEYGRLNPNVSNSQRRRYRKNAPIEELTKEDIAMTLTDILIPSNDLIQKYLQKNLAVVNHVEPAIIHTLEHDLVGSTDISQLPQWPQVHILLVDYFNNLRQGLRTLQFGDNILLTPFDYPLTESMNILYFTGKSDVQDQSIIEAQTKEVEKRINVSDKYLQHRLKLINRGLKHNVSLTFRTIPKTFYPEDYSNLVIPANPFDYTPFTRPTYLNDATLIRENKHPDFRKVVRR